MGVAPSVAVVVLLATVALSTGACGAAPSAQSNAASSQGPSAGALTPTPTNAPGAAADLPLRGVDWVLTTLAAPEGTARAVDDRATLRLDAAGTFAGSTGCRHFNGRFIDVEGGISLTDLNLAQVACPDVLSRQDRFVVAILQDGLAVSIEGDRLTITSPGGQQLIYTAR